MQQGDTTKKGLFERLPKFSRASILILMVGIFLIILIALMLITNKQKSEGPALQNEVANLQKIAAGPTVQLGTLQEKVGNAQAGYDSLKSQFPDAAKSNQVVSDLLNLAQESQVDIVGLTLGSSEKTFNINGAELKYRVLTYTINLSGEAARMQTFIYDLRQMNTCRISSITIAPSTTETEMDTGTVKIDVLLSK